MSFKSVMVTGTKGKTTVTYLIDEMLMALGKKTIRVDTTGHFVDGERKSTLDESKKIWGLVPTVCPGRYLWELKNFSEEEIDNTVGVLESALGCSNLPGTGIKFHDVGVWTNVLEDHLGSNVRLQTREDIASAKGFIFERLQRDTGIAIFNACDDLVCSKLSLAPENTTFLPLVHDNADLVFDLDAHLENGGTTFVLHGTKIFKKTKDAETLVYDAVNLPWTFSGFFFPSMFNLMCAIVAVYALYGCKLPNGLTEIIDRIRLDPYGGRLTVLKAKNGTTIIADYAHEKESLVSVGKLAKKLADEKGGKTIGVVRLAYDRTNELIDKTGQAIGTAFDELVVYDKIDGYWRQPVPVPAARFKQEVGKISGLLGDAIRKTNEHVDVILREDEALAFAANKAGTNDVVVVIVNDDIRRSIGWIREKFEADFA